MVRSVEARPIALSAAVGIALEPPNRLRRFRSSSVSATTRIHEPHWFRPSLPADERERAAPLYCWSVGQEALCFSAIARHLEIAQYRREIRFVWMLAARASLTPR